jgi:hypothetical protein
MEMGWTAAVVSALSLAVQRKGGEGLCS